VTSLFESAATDFSPFTRALTKQIVDQQRRIYSETDNVTTAATQQCMAAVADKRQAFHFQAEECAAETPERVQAALNSATAAVIALAYVLDTPYSHQGLGSGLTLLKEAVFSAGLVGTAVIQPRDIYRDVHRADDRHLIPTERGSGLPQRTEAPPEEAPPQPPPDDLQAGDAPPADDAAEGEVRVKTEDAEDILSSAEEDAEDFEGDWGKARTEYASTVPLEEMEPYPVRYKVLGVLPTLSNWKTLYVPPPKAGEDEAQTKKRGRQVLLSTHSPVRPGVQDYCLSISTVCTCPAVLIACVQLPCGIVLSTASPTCNTSVAKELVGG
jgi:hypothetical protein